MTAVSPRFGLVDRIIGEPLVSFLLIGGLLFLLYSVVSSDDKPVISVSSDFIDSMVADRELVLERTLSEKEKDALRQSFIDQEVLVREAMSRKLYLNDGQVRHRLADKMFYLLADDIAEPTAADLEAFYQSRRHLYRTPELITFSHRYFESDEAAAEKALQGGVVGEVGGRFYMGLEIERYAPPELIAIFGLAFTKQLGDLPLDEWQGPIESGRGWHLVKVHSRESQTDIPVADLQNRLLADWRGTQLAESRQRKLDALRENYRVVVSDSTVGN